MTDLLLGHELDQVTIIRVQAGCLELGIRETLQSIAEQVEFNPLLVESQVLNVNRSVLFKKKKKRTTCARTMDW
jgi:hypothetical protein